VVPSYSGDGKERSLEEYASPGEKVDGNETPRRHHYSIADYHEAYASRRLTPISVARAIVDLVSQDSKYKAVFIDIRKEHLLAAAEASTKRFREGRPLGILDGVPVAIKDEVDLSGCKKTLGSVNDFTRADGQTSWCVQKLEDSGAAILGKVNMHEIGLGECSLLARFNINHVSNTILRHFKQQYSSRDASQPPFSSSLSWWLIRRLRICRISRPCAPCPRC